MIKNRKEANPMTDQTWCPIGSLQKHGHNVSSLHRLTPKTETSAYTFYIFWLYPKEKMFMLSKQLGSLRLSHRSMWFFLNIPFFKHSVNKKAPLFLFFSVVDHIFFMALTVSSMASRGSLGAGIFKSVGSTPHTSVAYSVMVRSLENFPVAAMFLITILVHWTGS